MRVLAIMLLSALLVGGCMTRDVTLTDEQVKQLKENRMNFAIRTIENYTGRLDSPVGEEIRDWVSEHPTASRIALDLLGFRLGEFEVRYPDKVSLIAIYRSKYDAAVKMFVEVTGEEYRSYHEV